MIAHHNIYTGRVQGVGFRYSVKQVAMGCDVSGFVKNLPDGTVELWVQGEAGEVKELEEGVMESHLKGFIKKVESREAEPRPELTGFRIEH